MHYTNIEGRGEAPTGETKMTNLTSIDIADLDPALVADIDAPVNEFTAWEAPYEAATVANQHYEIVHHAASRRGGIVFVGSGSSGRTEWTDAETPEEVLARYLADEMIS